MFEYRFERQQRFDYFFLALVLSQIIFNVEMKIINKFLKGAILMPNAYYLSPSTQQIK